MWSEPGRDIWRIFKAETGGKTRDMMMMIDLYIPVQVHFITVHN